MRLRRHADHRRHDPRGFGRDCWLVCHLGILTWTGAAMKLSRRLPRGFEIQIRRYALHTGLASWAWARVHSHLFLIFWFTMSNRNATDGHSTAHSIWNQIQNDSTQREMLLGVIRIRLVDHKQLVDATEWVIKTLNRLSLYRNIIAHTAALFSPYLKRTPAADPAGARIMHRQRFDIIAHDRFWRDLAGDLNALANYSLAIASMMHDPSKPRASLRKPKLLSLAQIDRIDSQISRLVQSKERSRQQPSSKAKPRTKRRNARAP